MPRRFLFSDFLGAAGQSDKAAGFHDVAPPPPYSDNHHK